MPSKCNKPRLSDGGFLSGLTDDLRSVHEAGGSVQDEMNRMLGKSGVSLGLQAVTGTVGMYQDLKGRRARNQNANNLTGYTSEDTDPFLMMGGGIPGMEGGAAPMGIPGMGAPSPGAAIPMGGGAAFEGPPHEAGGIPVDPTGQPVPEGDPTQAAEVEGGEAMYTFPDGGEFVFSDRLTDPQTGKTFADEAKRILAAIQADPSRKTELEIELEALKNRNVEAKADAPPESPGSVPVDAMGPATAPAGAPPGGPVDPGMIEAMMAGGTPPGLGGAPLPPAGGMAAGAEPMLGFGGPLNGHRGSGRRSGVDAEPRERKPEPGVMDKIAGYGREAVAYVESLGADLAEAFNPDPPRPSGSGLDHRTLPFDRKVDFRTPEHEHRSTTKLADGGYVNGDPVVTGKREGRAGLPLLPPELTPVSPMNLPTLPRIPEVAQASRSTPADRGGSDYMDHVRAQLDPALEARDSPDSPTNHAYGRYVASQLDVPAARRGPLGGIANGIAQLMGGADDIGRAANPYATQAAHAAQSVKPVNSVAIRNRARLEANAAAAPASAFGASANAAARQASSSAAARATAEGVNQAAAANNQSAIASSQSLHRIGATEQASTQRQIASQLGADAALDNQRSMIANAIDRRGIDYRKEQMNRHARRMEAAERLRRERLGLSDIGRVPVNGRVVEKQTMRDLSSLDSYLDLYARPQ